MNFLMNKFTLIIGGLLFGLIVSSYLSSVIFFLLSDYDPNSAMPWSIWFYLFSYSIEPKLIISLIIPHILLIFFIAKMLIKKEPEFGDARWANWQDINEAGLFKQKGLLLGKYKGKYLVSDSPTHAMIIAPTRSGKGTGLVIPNLLNWEDSVICLDVKHENYKFTAGFRKSCGHKVFMWSPFDQNLKSHRYNPLDAVSKDPHQKINDLKIIGKILIPDPTHGDKFWTSEARTLFVGLMLYVMGNSDMPSTIGSIYRLLGTEEDLGDIARHIVKTHKELPLTGKKTLMNFANKAAKERSGVKSNLSEAINLWDSEVVDAATSASDFSIADLRKQRMAIYVGVLTGQIATLTPLLRIFFEQVITIMSLKEPDKTEPYKVMMMMDEFHLLGEMASMTTAFTLLAGYNCRVVAVTQGLNWVDVAYGQQKRNGILSCCAHQIFYSANDLETATYISNSCGEETIETVSTSQRQSFGYEPPSKNKIFKARPLITKDKAKRIAKTEAIIITESSFPIKAKKIHFQDKDFEGRVLPAPEIPTLEMMHNEIPEFDIPDKKTLEKQKPDPNQTNMFESKNNDTIPKNLTDELDD